MDSSVFWISFWAAIHLAISLRLERALFCHVLSTLALPCSYIVAIISYIVANSCYWLHCCDMILQLLATWLHVVACGCYSYSLYTLCQSMLIQVCFLTESEISYTQTPFYLSAYLTYNPE